MLTLFSASIARVDTEEYGGQNKEPRKHLASLKRRVYVPFHSRSTLSLIATCSHIHPSMRTWHSIFLRLKLQLCKNVAQYLFVTIEHVELV